MSARRPASPYHCQDSTARLSLSPLRDRHAALNGFGRRAICQIDWKIRCGAVFYRGDKPTRPRQDAHEGALLCGRSCGAYREFLGRSGATASAVAGLPARARCAYGGDSRAAADRKQLISRAPVARSE